MIHDKDFKYEDISIWLKKGDKRPIFCMICRQGLPFHVEGKVVEIMPGNANAEQTKNMPLPFIVPCNSFSAKYGTCPARYIIQGIVE